MLPTIHGENDSSHWEVSHTQTPFSKFILKKYLENSHLDIYESKQLRLIISENEKNESVGMIDLFDFNPQHQRAGIGILLLDKFAKKGYASEALSLLISYCFETLQVHQVYASMTKDNKESIALFKKHNFKNTGLKRDWIATKDGFKDELFYQLINE